jgi:GTP-binding protein LepA
MRSNRRPALAVPRAGVAGWGDEEVDPSHRPPPPQQEPHTPRQDPRAENAILRQPMDRIRNFSIIAHIDHGKSTLADRILEITRAVDPKKMRAQVLDSMDLERERGITIKAQAVRVEYEASDGQTYHLHLIDTPGHVDFSYEVSRSLAACEGALLVVDAAQGVEAQTVANTYLAIENGLELIPVINKVDLPGAEPERVAEEIADLLGGDPGEALPISAKTGEGVVEVLEAIVARVPPPSGEPAAPTRALIFDSEFDQYRGVVAYVRMVDGVFRKGERIVAMQNGTEADIDDLGFFRPAMTPVAGMEAGDVGYLITGIKDVAKLRVGDTLTAQGRPASEPLEGYREVRPMVFCGLFPIDTDRYEDLRDALDKLALNDAALSYEPETSEALGFGFRAGFLGLLHMEIVRERLEREYGLELLATTPNVRYEVHLTSGGTLEVHSPTELPDPSKIEAIEEPYIRATIICPTEHVGAVMDLCQTRRGTHVDMHYLSPQRVQIRYDLPLAEIVLDFFDYLKSSTKGYASLDYEPIGNRASDLVKVDILLAGDQVDALSIVVHRDAAYEQGKRLVERLRKTIPRQLFDVPVQAAVGSRILARETVKALRKDVTAKLYGGDVTRKQKLLKKQKAGKKRMKQVGRVEVPQEAFLAVLEIDE